MSTNADVPYPLYNDNDDKYEINDDNYDDENNHGNVLNEM